MTLRSYVYMMGALILIGINLLVFVTSPSPPKSIFTTISSELSSESMGSPIADGYKSQAKENNHFVCDVTVKPAEFVYDGKKHRIADAWIEKRYFPRYSSPHSKPLNYYLILNLDKTDWGKDEFKLPKLTLPDQTSIYPCDYEYKTMSYWQYSEDFSEEDLRSKNLKILFEPQERKTFGTDDTFTSRWQKLLGFFERPKPKTPETEVTLTW